MTAGPLYAFRMAAIKAAEHRRRPIRQRMSGCSEECREKWRLQRPITVMSGLIMAMRLMVPARQQCPHCGVSGEMISAWRTLADMVFLCGMCDHTWSMGIHTDHREHEYSLSRML